MARYDSVHVQWCANLGLTCHVIPPPPEWKIVSSSILGNLVPKSGQNEVIRSEISNKSDNAHSGQKSAIYDSRTFRAVMLHAGVLQIDFAWS
jgi:hypothetical protein